MPEVLQHIRAGTRKEVHLALPENEEIIAVQILTDLFSAILTDFRLLKFFILFSLHPNVHGSRTPPLWPFWRISKV